MHLWCCTSGAARMVRPGATPLECRWVPLAPPTVLRLALELHLWCCASGASLGAFGPFDKSAWFALGLLAWFALELLLWSVVGCLWSLRIVRMVRPGTAPLVLRLWCVVGCLWSLRQVLMVRPGTARMVRPGATPLEFRWVPLVPSISSHGSPWNCAFGAAPLAPSWRFAARPNNPKSHEEVKIRHKLTGEDQRVR